MTATTEDSNQGDDLITVAKARNEFEAEIIVAALRDEGIEAFSFGMFRNILPVDSRFTGVPVQVRARDRARAQHVLDQRDAEPAAVDWDEVDVGEREDRLPLRTPGRMPWPARIAFVVATLLALLIFVGFAVMAVW